MVRRSGRNRNITPDNKCLIFYIYIWTLNIDIQSLYIYIYIYIYILYIYILYIYSYDIQFARQRKFTGYFKTYVPGRK